MRRRQNVAYENEFPTLSETSAISDVKSSVDYFSYSSKLRISSPEKVHDSKTSTLSKISSSKSDSCEPPSSIKGETSTSIAYPSKNINAKFPSSKNNFLPLESLNAKALKPNNKHAKTDPTLVCSDELKNETAKQNNTETGWTVVRKKGISGQKSFKNNVQNQYKSRVETNATASSSSFSDKTNNLINPIKNSNRKICDISSSKAKFKEQGKKFLTQDEKFYGSQDKKKNKYSDEYKKDFQQKSSGFKSFRNSSETNHKCMFQKENCYAENSKNIKKTFYPVQSFENQNDVYNKKENKIQFSTKRKENNISQENNYFGPKLRNSASNLVLNLKSPKKNFNETNSISHQRNKKTLNTGFDVAQKCQQSSLPDKNSLLSHKSNSKSSQTSNDKIDDGILNPFKSSRKKRKSKLKRQAALQSNKIQIISAEVHHKILNQNKTESLSTQKEVSNIFDSKEYPELNETVSFHKSNNAEELSLRRNFQDLNHSRNEKEDNQSLSDISSDGAIQGKVCESSVNVQENAELEKVPVHSSNPISISLFDMLLANKSKKKNPEKCNKLTLEHSVPKIKPKKYSLSHFSHQVVNPLDSSKPAVKRGKEREKPKLKKPSLLKKIILLDRERRKAKLMTKCNEKDVKQNDVDFFTVNAEQSQNFQDAEINFSLLESNSDSLDCYLPEIKWLFGFRGKCFHRISETKCTICNENEVVGDDILLYLPFLFETEKKTSHNKKPQDCVDYILSDVRRLFRNNVESECSSHKMLLDSVISDIKYLFNEEQILDVHLNENSVSHDENILRSHISFAKDLNNLGISNSEIEVGTSSKKICNDFSFTSDERAYSSLDQINSTFFHTDCPKKELIAASYVAIHSKKFREYCNHFLNKDLEETVSALIDDLARFQDRMHQKDPVKARMKRRLLYGIREIKRHMKLKKLKCIIIASDIENSDSEGGLNDIINELKSLAKDFRIPCVFALQRRKLGRVCRKPSPVSSVGILNYEGSEVNFKKMLAVQSECKRDYDKVIKALSSNFSDEQATLLIKTKEENSGQLHSVIMTLLKDLFPKSIHITMNNISNTCDIKINSSNTEKKEISLFKDNKDCDLTDKIEIYDILNKYKIINY